MTRTTAQMWPLYAVHASWTAVLLECHDFGTQGASSTPYPVTLHLTQNGVLVSRPEFQRPWSLWLENALALGTRVVRRVGVARTSGGPGAGGCSAISNWSSER